MQEGKTEEKRQQSKQSRNTLPFLRGLLVAVGVSRPKDFMGDPKEDCHLLIDSEHLLFPEAVSVRQLLSLQKYVFRSA